MKSHHNRSTKIYPKINSNSFRFFYFKIILSLKNVSRYIFRQFDYIFVYKRIEIHVTVINTSLHVKYVFGL